MQEAALEALQTDGWDGAMTVVRVPLLVAEVMGGHSERRGQLGDEGTEARWTHDGDVDCRRAAKFVQSPS
jgi:hypothetical protein